MAGNFPGSCLCSVFGAGIFIAGCTVLLVSAFPIAEIAIGAVYMYECPAAPMIPVYVMVCGILGLLLMSALALPNLFCPTRKSNMVLTLWNLSLLLVYIIWFLYGSYQIYSIYPPNYDRNTATMPGNKLSNTTENPTQGPVILNQTRSLPILNQTQNLPNVNQTWIITTKVPARKLLQLWRMSTRVNKENLNPPHTHQVLLLEPYCDRTVYLFSFWTTTLVYVFGGNALVILICICGFMKIGNMLTKYLF
ncbi:uncharacterized protein LOC115423136 [Sphaeramia orbicularis]|uniref:uncharacterized protein LOC115423136 n=1 Tax=Sphaeramia orbicularis TaxID=375764 RepID=UPI001181386F|nr:uncharacterized protein LOC115423136 [Sphaeramia orbicularis]XP_029995744.1 uncharacterized protein LOC115423136 [Sphaeramia orbicularis]